MTDYTHARFYAISTIGYGRGRTAEEAVENYYDYLQADLSFLAASKAGRVAKLQSDYEPTVFEAPAAATGFTLVGMHVKWNTPDGLVPATDDQKVSTPAG